MINWNYFQALASLLHREAIATAFLFLFSVLPVPSVVQTILGSGRRPGCVLCGKKTIYTRLPWGSKKGSVPY